MKRMMVAALALLALSGGFPLVHAQVATECLGQCADDLDDCTIACTRGDASGECLDDCRLSEADCVDGCPSSTLDTLDPDAPSDSE